MNNVSVSRPATLLLNLLISTKDHGFLGRVRWSALITVRRVLLRFSDPTVEYRFCGATLRIPLSHDLPLNRRAFPLYSENLGRIAAHLSEKFGAFPVIDIGANIGDTVAIIHQYTQPPILCIEGEPKFARLLAVNVASKLPSPVIEPSFVGRGGGALASLVHDGTARLVNCTAGDGAIIRTKGFEQILDEHPSFQASRLLKIDTDGMDIDILNSAYDWISRQKPVLFFEYDPDLQRAHGDDGLELLGRLRDAGYHRVLVYENIGDYMFSAELGNETLLSELHEFFSGWQSKRYCDLCVFHREDEDIAQALRRCEMDFFRAARSRAPAGLANG
jgi:FkbM family methyltransferase